MACAGCGESVAAGARFCSVCGRAVSYAAVSPPPPHGPLLSAPSFDGLVRPREGRMVAGVCAGFAQRFGWDITIVRLVVVLSVLGAGLPALAYLIAWVLMPNGQYALPNHTGDGTTGSMRV